MWDRRQVELGEGQLLRVVRDMGHRHLLDYLFFHLDGLDDWNVLDDFVRLSYLDCFEDWNLLDNFNLGGRWKFK